VSRNRPFTKAWCRAPFRRTARANLPLRFSNVYGPFSYHKGSVVAQFFRNLMQKQPLIVYGDGQQTRDFVFVSDLVEAIMLADKADAAGEVFQIASGVETSLRSLLATMKEVLPGVSIDVRYEPARAGEISRNYASIEKARRMLGFNPQTKLEQGLKDTWNWFQQNAKQAV